MPKHFDPAKDIPDLNGRAVVVTGGNAGLGYETVLAIAAHDPSNLFLCARQLSAAESCIANIREQYPQTSTRAVQLNLASFDSINAAATEINSSCGVIDVLFLNAGVAAVAHGVTMEGYEIQMGVNHIGHALFTQLLMPKVLKATAPRIVVVASMAAKGSKGIPLESLKTPMADISGTKKYQDSKLANVYFAQSLAKHYPSVITSAPHPGLVSTGIWDKAETMPRTQALLMAPIVWAFAVNPKKGVLNQLWCAFAEGVKSGQYYEPVGKQVRGSDVSNETARRDQLWEWTEKELAAHGAPGWPAA